MITGGALGLVLVVFLAIVLRLLDHYFADLQDALIAQKISQIVAMLDQTAAAQAQMVTDYAQWDDTFEFLNGRYEDFLDDAFGPATNTTKQDLVLAFDSGRRLFGTVVAKGGFVPDEAIFVASGLLADRPRSGLLCYGEHVLLLSARPVSTSRGDGPSPGWLVMGAFLDPDMLAPVVETTGTALRVEPYADGIKSGAEEFATQLTSRRLGIVSVAFPKADVASVLDGNFFASIRFACVDGEGEAVLRAEIPNTIHHKAAETRGWILVLSILFGLILVVTGFFAMEVSLMRPLAALDREMRQIATSPGGRELLSEARDDEIGRLASSANILFKRALDGRQEAEDGRVLLESILNTATEGVLASRAVRDSAGRIVDFEIVLANQSVERLTGRPAGDLRGARLLDAFPGNRDSETFARMVRVAESREPLIFEKHYSTDGIDGWFRDSISPWGDGVVVTFDDITARKDSERQLRESLEEIERFNAAMIGREERILAMKAEVNQLCARLGMPPIYGEEANG